MKLSKLKLKRRRPALGTYVEIELEAAAPLDQLHAWITQGFEAIAEIDRLMSFHRPESDLSRLNRARSGAWVTVDPHTRRVLTAAQALYETSAGAWDIRCGAALVQQNVLPSIHGRSSFSSTRPGRPPVELRGGRARRTGADVLDLGGIAKGYAVDYAVRTLQRCAGKISSSGVVNAGGDLRAWGRRPQMFSIHLPETQESVALPPQRGETALATSSIRPCGASERWSAAAHVRMPQGTLIRRPRTATVFADACWQADALTKIVLTASRAVATKCLRIYGAYALVLGPGGRLRQVLG